MIKRWLHKIKFWLVGDIHYQLAQLYNKISLLEEMNIQLMKAAELLPPVVPAPKMWDCGHNHISGVAYKTGITKCLSCHR